MSTLSQGISFQQRLKRIGELEELPTSARHVLLVLFLFADKDGYAFPSRKTIARQCNFGTPSKPRAETVSKAMKLLSAYQVDGVQLVVRLRTSRHPNGVRLHPFLCEATAGKYVLRTLERDGVEVKCASRTGACASRTGQSSPRVPPSEESQFEDVSDAAKVEIPSAPVGAKLASVLPRDSVELFNDCVDRAAEELEGRGLHLPDIERLRNTFRRFAMEAGEWPMSWEWFAAESRRGVSRIDRAETYFSSARLEQC